MKDLGANTMEQPKKILVPVDLSKRSEVGVEYAAMLATSVDAELVVMVNVNLPERALLEEFAARENIGLEEAGQAAIHRIITTKAPDVRSSIVVSYRDFPGDAILEVAAAEHVDMIVIASHGRSGMTRWMLGSVAEKIARGAKVPVVIVPARD